MSEPGSDQLSVYYSKVDESIEASGPVHMMLTDQDLAKIHIAASSRSVIEMANAVSSIDSLMAILETRLQVFIYPILSFCWLKVETLLKYPLKI